MTVAEAFLRGERDGTRYRLAAGRTPPPGREGPVASRRAGSSLEFHDHRDYEPGDDLRFVDWQAFARSERLVVKRHREEVAPHVDLLVDGSRSMGAQFPEKASAAAFVAGLLAGAARATGLSVTTWLLGDRPARVAAPGRRAAGPAAGAQLAC
ncbi:MAG: DUF58 domain-containing protein, partial [Acidobacteria bacterium]|nr:DUF58 domain-containing protein [Acidobacteriota bacterium]